MGATEIAPTAPHATAPTTGDRSRPARFWADHRVRLVLGIALALSLAFHVGVAPWNLFPDPSGIELKDVEGELTIPVDLLGEEPPAPPPDPPPSQAPVREGEGASASDAGPRPIADASPDADADAGREAVDGGPEDGGGAPDSGRDAGDGGGDAGLVAAAGDGGASGAQDPGAMIGMPGIVTAGLVNVTLLVNIAVIRTNPVGARIGPLLHGIPQWNEFMRGAQTGIDPVRDTDWILIYGPSLIHTERDAVIVRYSTSDAVVDEAVDAIARRYEHGGRFDTGVPGVRAALGHADNAKRVFLRAQPQVLVIVPPDKAREFARVMRRAPIAPKVRAGEAMRLTVRDPWRQISIPGLKFPDSMRELRIWIEPRAADGGADVYAEGDCENEAAAEDAALAMTELLRRQNSTIVRVGTRGLLNNAKVTAKGNKIQSHLDASRDQLEAVLQLMAAFLGANVDPPPP